MANSYNSSPIVLVATMASGWKSLQTLVNASNAVLGRVTKVIWTGMVAAGHQFTIVDPNDSTNLLQGSAGTTLIDQEYDFDNAAAAWRDFQLTRIDSGTLLIWSRQ